MKFSKGIAAASLLMLLALPCVSFAQTAPSVESLQSVVQSLLAQLQSLQAKVTQMQSGQAVSWCHTFTNNLEVGSTGTDVAALQTALSRDGETVGVTDIFDDQTASAVTGFQQKYASDILTPNGLQNGTGYAGRSTRSKLNALFSCGSTTPSPISTMPPVITTPITAPTPIAAPSVITSPVTVVSSSVPTLTMDAYNTGINTNVYVGSGANLVGRWDFTASGTGEIFLKGITFHIAGSASTSDFQNVRLLLNSKQVGPTLSALPTNAQNNGVVNFDLSANSIGLIPGLNIIGILTDISSAASPESTFQFNIMNTADVNAVNGNGVPVQENLMNGFGPQMQIVHQ